MRSRLSCHPSIRSALAVLALVVAAGAGGCTKDTVVTTRSVIVNAPAGCALNGQDFATYNPLGDFEPPPAPAGVDLKTVGSVLSQVDARTRAVEVTATNNVSPWVGVAAVPPSGDVNLLILPQDQACALTANVGARTGSTLGAIGSQRALLVGGTGTTVQGVTVSFVARLDTGEVAAASPILGTPRTHASVTAFGTGGLVAGGFGATPSGSPPGPPLDDAQVFDPAVGGFTTHIKLRQARAAHGSVVLANGSTLLVGGVGADGKPLQTMDLVTPTAGGGASDELLFLSSALTSPVAIRLASGEILVAGGTTVGNAPVTSLQWLEPDASAEANSAVTIPAGSGVALIALQGGGALAVVAPPTPTPANFQTTYVISAGHGVAAGNVVEGSLTKPVLFGGAGGKPLLWTGDRWLQWQPWAGAFGISVVLDEAANIGDANTSPDPGLAMWLDPVKDRIVALRTDTSNAYSADLPLLVAGSGATGADGIAPDQLPGFTSLSYNGGTGLTLAAGASAFVTDRTYADVSIRATYATGQPPSVVLRDDQGDSPQIIDDTCCPGLLAATLAESVIDVERAGSTVTCSVNGGTPATCSGSFAAGVRVSVGVRGAIQGSTSVVREIVVQRVGSP